MNSTTTTTTCDAVWCDEGSHTTDAVIPYVVHGTRRGPWDVSMVDGEPGSARISWDGPRELTAAQAHGAQADLQRALRLLAQLGQQ